MRNRKAPASWLFAVLAAAICIGSATATAQSNRVQVENAKPGATDWLLTRVARHDDEILRARLASPERHRSLRVSHEHQGGRDAQRARQHVSGEQYPPASTGWGITAAPGRA